MRKTTVYLDEDEALRLKRLARERGKSQAELIREAISQLMGEPPRRKFHSMGSGSYPIKEPSDRRWNADELYRKVMGLD